MISCSDVEYTLESPQIKSPPCRMYVFSGSDCARSPLIPCATSGAISSIFHPICGSVIKRNDVPRSACGMFSRAIHSVRNCIRLAFFFPRFQRSGVRENVPIQILSTRILLCQKISFALMSSFCLECMIIRLYIF